MKRPRTIATMFASALVLVLAGYLFCMSATSQPKVTGPLRPEDPAQIRRVISRYRWTMVRESLADHDFRFLFSSPFFQLLSGRIREIGARRDKPFFGFVFVTPPSTAAYAISRCPYSQHSLQYNLKLTTNGWVVAQEIVYR